MERNETETTHAQVMLGILVIQDLALGLMLAILPALHQPGESIGLALFTAIVRIALFAAGAVVAGIWIMPRVLRFLARTESRELFLLGVVTLCLSIAILTEYLGLSIEMGAFVAGLMISEVEYADETLTIVEPLRDVFASLFFASIGMLIDPVFLWQNLDLILGLVALVFLGKFLIITPLVKLFRYPLKTALIAGLGLAQIGEFSFVLASEGQVLGLVSRHVYLLIVGTTAVTLMLTPFVLRVIPFLFNLVEFIPWLKPYLVDERAAGCNVYVTSGSDDKIKTALDMGAKGGANYKNANWDKELKSLSGGGFDAIVDSTAGDTFAKLVDIAKPAARIAMYGATLGPFNSGVPAKIFWKQLDILGSTMGNDEEFVEMLAFVNAHKIVPLVDSVFPMEKAQEAIDKMSKGEQLGKIVLKIS